MKKTPRAGLRHHTSPPAEQNGFPDWLLNCPKRYGSYLRLRATDLKYTVGNSSYECNHPCCVSNDQISLRTTR